MTLNTYTSMTLVRWVRPMLAMHFSVLAWIGIHCFCLCLGRARSCFDDLAFLQLHPGWWVCLVQQGRETVRVRVGWFVNTNSKHQFLDILASSNLCHNSLRVLSAEVFRWCSNGSKFVTNYTQLKLYQMFLLFPLIMPTPAHSHAQTTTTITTAKIVQIETD